MLSIPSEVHAVLLVCFESQYLLFRSSRSFSFHCFLTFRFTSVPLNLNILFNQATTIYFRPICLRLFEKKKLCKKKIEFPAINSRELNEELWVKSGTACVNIITECPKQKKEFAVFFKFDHFTVKILLVCINILRCHIISSKDLHSFRQFLY